MPETGGHRRRCRYRRRYRPRLVVQESAFCLHCVQDKKEGLWNWPIYSGGRRDGRGTACSNHAGRLRGSCLRLLCSTVSGFGCLLLLWDVWTDSAPPNLPATCDASILRLRLLDPNGLTLVRQWKDAARPVAVPNPIVRNEIHLTNGQLLQGRRALALTLRRNVATRPAPNQKSCRANNHPLIFRA